MNYLVCMGFYRDVLKFLLRMNWLMVRRLLFGYFDYFFSFCFFIIGVSSLLLGLQSYGSRGGLIVTFFFILFIEYATPLLLLL